MKEVLESLKRFSEENKDNAYFQTIIYTLENGSTDLIAETMNFICKQLQAKKDDIINTDLAMTRIDNEIINYNNYHGNKSIWKNSK